jgi:hypothetical protein
VHDVDRRKRALQMRGKLVQPKVHRASIGRAVVLR